MSEPSMLELIATAVNCDDALRELEKKDRSKWTQQYWQLLAAHEKEGTEGGSDEARVFGRG
jgi:hypothetical protein